jgi:hypothetical protein
MTLAEINKTVAEHQSILSSSFWSWHIRKLIASETADHGFDLCWKVPEVLGISSSNQIMER